MKEKKVGIVQKIILIYNTAFAAAVIAMVPVICIFLILQKQVVTGMTAGAVKG